MTLDGWHEFLDLSQRIVIPAGHAPLSTGIAQRRDEDHTASNTLLLLPGARVLLSILVRRQGLEGVQIMGVAAGRQSTDLGPSFSRFFRFRSVSNFFGIALR